MPNINIKPGDYVKAQSSGHYAYERSMVFSHFYPVMSCDLDHEPPRVLIAVKPELGSFYQIKAVAINPSRYLAINPSRYLLKHAEKNPNDTYIWIVSDTIVGWKGYRSHRS